MDMCKMLKIWLLRYNCVLKTYRAHAVALCMDIDVTETAEMHNAVAVPAMYGVQHFIALL